MLRDSSNFYGTGGEQSFDRNHPVSRMFGRMRLFINNPHTGEMEIKLILWILAGIGVPSYIWGLLLNAGTWKADVLFVVSLICTLIYIPFLVMFLIDKRTMRKINIKKAIKELERMEIDRPSELESKVDRMNKDLFRNL